MSRFLNSLVRETVGRVRAPFALVATSSPPIEEVHEEREITRTTSATQVGRGVEAPSTDLRGASQAQWSAQWSAQRNLTSDSKAQTETGLANPQAPLLTTKATQDGATAQQGVAQSNNAADKRRIAEPAELTEFPSGAVHEHARNSEPRSNEPDYVAPSSVNAPKVSTSKQENPAETSRPVARVVPSLPDLQASIDKVKEPIVTSADEKGPPSIEVTIGTLEVIVEADRSSPAQVSPSLAVVPSRSPQTGAPARRQVQPSSATSHLARRYLDR